MRASKLYQWLKKLPTQEQNEFLRYVNYGGGRNREELSSILALFLAKVVRGGEMSREAFWAECWGGEAFDPNRFNKRLSELKGLLDEFLGFQAMRQNPVTKTSLLAQALKQRNLGEFAQSERHDALKTLKNAPIDIADSVLQLQIEENFLQLELSSPRSSKRYDEPVFQELMQHVEQYYFAQMLRYACAALNQDRIFGTTHDYGALPSMLPHIERDLPRCHILVRLYYRIYMMQNEPETPSHFEALRDDLAREGARLEADLHRDLYMLAINHCVRRINLGEEAYFEKLSRIYSEIRETGVLLVNGYVNTGELKNIISVAVRSDKIALAYELLDAYGQRLLPGTEWAIAYNRAVIDYHRAVLYQAALGPQELAAARRSIEAEYVRIRKVFYELIGKSDDIFYDMDAKVYYLRVSNELGQFDMFEIQFEPLRVFLGRKKGISAAHKENYRQFIYFLKDLCRIRTDNSLTTKHRRDKLRKLEARLGAAYDIANISWLREKIKEALDK
jgi:hypothetical protein